MVARTWLLSSSSCSANNRAANALPSVVPGGGRKAGSGAAARRGRPARCGRSSRAGRRRPPSGKGRCGLLPLVSDSRAGTPGRCRGPCWRTGEAPQGDRSAGSRGAGSPRRVGSRSAVLDHESKREVRPAPATQQRAGASARTHVAANRPIRKRPRRRTSSGPADTAPGPAQTASVTRRTTHDPRP